MTKPNQDIIIIRRAPSTAPYKKSGVWKIAHADFMTAMMAFFLIMWLVNATDEEIRRSIANYFNPMNLMSSPTDRRGMLDPTNQTTPPASGQSGGKAAGERPMASDSPGQSGTRSGGGNVEFGDTRTMASNGALPKTEGPQFNDPYAVLTSEGADVTVREPIATDVPETTLGETGVTAETEDTRDPFDPVYWQARPRQQAQTLRPGQTSTAARQSNDIDAGEPRPRGEIETDPPQTVSGGTSASGATAGEPDPIEGVGPRSAAAEAILSAFRQQVTEANEFSPSSGQGDVEAEADGNRSAGVTAAQVAENLQAALSSTPVNVSVTTDGEAGQGAVLISLTDDTNVSMFPIGSADPNPEAAGIFAQVASTLGTLDGNIVIRGHTDARPFTSGRSDNWVLSFARAHATKRALTANGVSEQRIARVEGLADRELTIPSDPFADQNRRIEILYEPAETAQ